MDKVKWLLVGAGDISRKRVAAALAGAHSSEITAVCDPNTEACEKLADEQGVADRYADFGQALTKCNADAVYLATPVWLHASQMIEALKSGRHTIAEKPLALNGAEAQRAVETAQQTGLKAACAYYRRFFPKYDYTKELIDKGVLGDIVAVRINYLSYFNPTPDDPKYWRVVREKSGGGPISDMGTHMFDVMIGLLGMPASVYAICGNTTTAWDVEDSSAIVMQFASGAKVTASFNWNCKAWRHEFEIAGTEGKVDWLPFDAPTFTKTIGREISTIDLPTAENAHQPLIEDFVQSILDNREPAHSLKDSAMTNTLIDAIYESAENHTEIPI